MTCRFNITPKDFRREIRRAVRAYDKFCIVLELPPCDVEANIVNLVERALRLYTEKDRAMSSVISTNKCLTVQLSECTDDPIPNCSIYFNLHSHYVELAREKEKAKQ